MPKTIEKRMRILPLTLPILAENMLRLLFSFADMLMLSGLNIDGVRYGDDAVGAVGLVMSFVLFINILYMMINTGSGIIITQYSGAKQPEKARKTVVCGIVMSSAAAFIISLAIFLLANPIISIFRLNHIRHAFAVDYLTIYGSLSLGFAMNSVFSVILRSYGFSKEPTIINVAANIINIIGNYCFIYGAFGFPQWGVAGVAVSTVFSQGLGAVVMFLIILTKKEMAFSFKDFLKIKSASVKEILRIGVPTAGEFLSYNIAMIVMKYFVAQMDFPLPPLEQVNLPAYNYSMIFARFILYFGLSIGQGARITTGYLVGAGKKELAYKNVLKYLYISFILAFCLAGILTLFRETILSIFPMEKNVYDLCTILIPFTMILEPGRSFNLIIINGLKGAGDIDFPVKMGIVSMWGIGIVSAYVLGMVLKLGVIGIWLGISLDEWTRGIVMYIRWRRKTWQSKSRILNKAE